MLVEGIVVVILALCAGRPHCSFFLPRVLRYHFTCLKEIKLRDCVGFLFLTTPYIHNTAKFLCGMHQVLKEAYATRFAAEALFDHAFLHVDKYFLIG